MTSFSNTTSKRSYQAVNISATTASFQLVGGQYAVEINAAAWNGGSVGVNKLSIDGVTWLSALDPVTTNSATLITTPGGTYQIVVSGSPTGVYVNLNRIPSQSLT